MFTQTASLQQQPTLPFQTDWHWHITNLSGTELI